MKSYEKIKNMLVSAVAVVAMLANTVVIAEENEKDFVHTLKIDGDYLVISGESDFANNDINVFLLNEGKTVADLNEANSTGKIKAVANYCNVLSSDMNGNFSDRLNISDLDDEGRYLLYVKSGSDSYSKYIQKVQRFYVSASGNDATGDGSKSNPFKTINYARDYIRNIEKTVPIEVVMEEGVYNVSNTITFGSQDSGTKDAPITYKAAENAKVVFEGTTNLDVSKITSVTDEDIKERLMSSVADKVVEIDLAEQGIPETVVNYLVNCSPGISGKVMGVYLNDKPQNVSRWPNTGYTTVASVSSSGGSASEGTTSEGGAVFKITGVDSERATRWGNAADMYVEGYLANDWHGEWAKIGSVDASNLNITLSTHTQYGVVRGNRIAVVNLLEEIDIPGEWYADPDTMKMYYYPPHTLTENDELEIATLCKNLLNINDGAEYINIEGIEFAKNADSPEVALTNSQGGNGILITSGASNINIKNCIIRDIGMDGINSYGSDVTIDGCIIYNTGFSGISMKSGNRTTLKSGNTKISNCIITGISRDTGANSRVGITVNGVGTVVENNILFNLPNSAIRYEGNNHLIRYNEIYNSVNKTTDAGAIYSGRSWSEYGTVVKNNYFHEIGAGLTSEMAAAMFWDDLHSGNEFVGNIVNMNNKTKTAGAKIGGGRDNIVSGNVFVNATTGVKGQDRTTTVQPQTGLILKKDNMDFYNGSLFQTFKEAAIGVDNAYDITDNDWNEAYVTSFPKIMSNFFDLRTNKTYYRADTITNNVMYNCDYQTDLATAMKNDSTVSNNVTVSESDFVDAANGDYRIKSSSKTSLGLSADIPDENMNSIGLQNGYSINSDVAGFNLTYPANNSSIGGNKTELVWEKSPFADSYVYEVAVDSEFKNIVASGTTIYNTVSVEGLNADEYYWRVKAVNKSLQIGCEYWCNETFRFTTLGELIFEEIEYSSSENVVSYTVTNTQKTSDEFTVIAAVKTTEGKLVGVRTESKEMSAGESKDFTIGTSFETTLTDLNVEFYIWDSLGNMKNLTGKKVFKK